VVEAIEAGEWTYKCKEVVEVAVGFNQHDLEKGVSKSMIQHNKWQVEVGVCSHDVSLAKLAQVPLRRSATVMH
jgi:hypothetical protein